MSDEQLEMSRREFLCAGGSAFALSLMLGTGLSSYSTPARSAPLRALSDGEGHALLSMARTLFPHDMLDDGYYMAVVQSIDAKAAGDAKTRDMVTAGIARLNRATGRPFADLSEQARVNVLKTTEESDFFQMVYGETINGVYGNPAVWALFGYEGSSVEKGGYLTRGFDDIDWLPKQP
jgi:hypothetical protein